MADRALNAARCLTTGWNWPKELKESDFDARLARRENAFMHEHAGGRIEAWFFHVLRELPSPWIRSKPPRHRLMPFSLDRPSRPHPRRLVRTGAGAGAAGGWLCSSACSC
jgi:hypothetical protein